MVGVEASQLVGQPRALLLGLRDHVAHLAWRQARGLLGADGLTTRGHHPLEGATGQRSGGGGTERGQNLVEHAGLLLPV